MRASMQASISPSDGSLRANQKGGQEQPSRSPHILWIWTPRIDRATRPFLKFDTRIGDPPSGAPIFTVMALDP